jgi:hypothetical protein
MGADIPLHYDPHPAAMKVLPGLQQYSVEVFSLEYRLDPLGFRCIQRGILDRRIAAVAEFAVVPDAAKRTGDSEHE